MLAFLALVAAMSLPPASAADPPSQVQRPDGPSNEELIAMATKGDIHAQLSLAYRYRDGKGAQKDYAEAMQWDHLSGDRGDAGAMDSVGWMFFAGLGVKHNPAVLGHRGLASVCNDAVG